MTLGSKRAQAARPSINTERREVHDESDATNPSRASSQSSTRSPETAVSAVIAHPALHWSQLAPREQQSSTSVSKRARVSKLARSFATLVAIGSAIRHGVREKKTVALPEKTMYSGMPQRRPTRARAHRDERAHPSPHFFLSIFCILSACIMGEVT